MATASCGTHSVTKQLDIRPRLRSLNEVHYTRVHVPALVLFAVPVTVEDIDPGFAKHKAADQKALRALWPEFVRTLNDSRADVAGRPTRRKRRVMRACARDKHFARVDTQEVPTMEGTEGDCRRRYGSHPK